jgi:hypothetical protein
MTGIDTTSVALRMRDVGMALRTASTHGQLLNRIRLQKFIYLMDAVAIVFREIPQREGYVTFKHGPFDRKVQNAVDVLAFRGLVSIASLTKSAERNLSVEYRLTDAGIEWAERLARNPGGGERSAIAAEVGKRIDGLGWGRLRELVYAEPTFVGLRSDGWGRDLRPSQGLENSSARLIQVVIRSLSATGGQPTRQAVLDVYFRYLDRYAKGFRASGGATT